MEVAAVPKEVALRRCHSTVASLGPSVGFASAFRSRSASRPVGHAQHVRERTPGIGFERHLADDRSRQIEGPVRNGGV